MTVRLSTGARDAMMGNGSSVGLRDALASGFMWIFDGTQPATADTGATGNLLGKVTVNGDGTTGLTFLASSSGLIAKNTGEVWRFTGLANGTAGWFRFSDSADTPTNTSSTAKRVDGLIATAGGDINISNTAVVTGAMSTVDNFTITEPAF